MLYTHTAEPLNTELETPDVDVKVGKIKVRLGYYLNAKSEDLFDLPFDL